MSPVQNSSIFHWGGKKPVLTRAAGIRYNAGSAVAGASGGRVSATTFRSIMNKQSESIDVKNYMSQLGQRARAASREIGRAETAMKDRALNIMADRIDAEAEKLKQANALDLQAGKAKGLDAALLDRLALTDKGIRSMSEGLRQTITNAFGNRLIGMKRLRAAAQNTGVARLQTQ
ncbi:MAG: hypothetical protein LC687_06345, partial [Actinobacteria bacterium]|nr:hypothetical protein [Actinomycetota bacterium]